MHLKDTCGFIFFFVTTSLVYSQQKQVTVKEQAWIGYYNQTRFTNKSGLSLDMHWRRTGNFINNNSVAFVRLAYIYYLTEQTKLMAGYVYYVQYGKPNIPEHRGWQQIQWFEKKTWYSLMQWVRLEERFRTKVSEGQLTNSYNFNFRLRYNISMSIPLKGKQIVAGTPFIYFQEEVFLNAGKNIVYNYFDQNRLFLGLGYQFSPRLYAHLGYLNVFQQLADGNKFVNTNAIRLFIFHNLDLRRKG